MRRDLFDEDINNVTDYHKNFKGRIESNEMLSFKLIMSVSPVNLQFYFQYMC